MCVSTAYKHDEAGDVLAEYIAAIKLQGSTIILTDIMGKETAIEGTLTSADLTRGTIIIEPQ